jgi:hypothetical protein
LAPDAGYSILVRIQRLSRWDSYSQSSNEQLLQHGLYTNKRMAVSRAFSGREVRATQEIEAKEVRKFL